MPQLTQFMTVYQSQWFWLLLVLGAIYFIVGRGIVTKVEDTVDDRDAKIASDLAAAERARSEADSIEDRLRTRMNDVHAEAQELAAAAKAKANAAAEKRIATADAALASKAEEASAKLAEARAAAMAAIEDVASDVTRDIVAKLTGQKVSDAEVRKAVAGALTHG